MTTPLVLVMICILHGDTAPRMSWLPRERDMELVIGVHFDFCKRRRTASGAKLRTL